MAEDNVIPLFMTDADLEAAWERYDAAMRRVHQLYTDIDSDRETRIEAVFVSMRAEKEMRAVFNRVPVPTDTARRGRGA